MSDEKFKMLLEAAPEAIIISDKNGRITLVNTQCEKYFGYTREELLGEFVEILVPDSLQEIHKKHRQIYMDNPVTRPMGAGLNIAAKRKDGSIFPLDVSLSPYGAGDDLLIMAIAHDITEHKQIEEKLKHLAEHDPLTGLINKPLIEDRIDHAITLAKRYNSYIAVLFLDLDQFKQINDLYGHAVGDLLLITASKRIQECIRDSDTLARIGGDEFVLLLTDLRDENAAIEIAKKIIQRFSEYFLIEDKKFITTLSIGIGLYPKNGNNAQTLIEKADFAMYYVKRHGKNNYELFDNLFTQL